MGIVRMVVEATTTDAAAEIERKLLVSTKIHRTHFSVLMKSYFANLLTFLKPTASLRRAQEVAALSSTRLPRPDVGGFDNKCLSQCRLIAFSNDFFRCPHENIGEATRVQI